MRGTKFGRIELVAKNTSFDTEPGPDQALPAPSWSKDIRNYYNAVVEEPVPQEFLDLLARIASDIAE
jgi:hypothetical protein